MRSHRYHPVAARRTSSLSSSVREEATTLPSPIDLDFDSPHHRHDLRPSRLYFLNRQAGFAFILAHNSPSANAFCVASDASLVESGIWIGMSNQTSFDLRLFRETRSAVT